MLSGLLPYGGIALAALVEGEVTYIGAATLVAEGRLDPMAVLIAGAIGAAIGDQALFYLFRGRRHASLLGLLIRFAPGLRIALAAAWAAADVPAWTVSTLNLLSAFVWAAAVLGLVAWLGPTYLATFGLAGWRGALVAGVLILVVFRVLGSYERRAIERI